MSAAGPLRAVAFGTPDGSLWAAAVDLGQPALVVGTKAAGLAAAYHLVWSEQPDGSWRIEGDGVGVDLTVTPISGPPEKTDPVEATGPAEATDDDERPASPLPPPGPNAPQLCRVTGTVHVDGDVSVDCGGVRVLTAPARSAKAAPASARLVAGWLDDGGAVALSAVRPRNASHQDDDVVSAALFDPDAWIGVTDPRLSTTYDASGLPTRTNLELWVGQGEDEFPRRTAGEASGQAGSVVGDGVSLQVNLLACHSRGHEGVGVYALATFA
jgi:hypothetical protein